MNTLIACAYTYVYQGEWTERRTPYVNNEVVPVVFGGEEGRGSGEYIVLHRILYYTIIHRFATSDTRLLFFVLSSSNCHLLPITE